MCYPSPSHASLPQAPFTAPRHMSRPPEEMVAYLKPALPCPSPASATFFQAHAAGGVVMASALQQPPAPAPVARAGGSAGRHFPREMAEAIV